MATKEVLFQKISQLTDDQKCEVEAYLNSILKQSEVPSIKFDVGKGLATMADDFDAPLQDFKEYME